MHLISKLLLVAGLFFSQAPSPTPLIQGDRRVQVSEHVYVIPDGNVGGVPNVGIVVGENAVLVVDTGLGPRNGEIVAGQAAMLLPNADIYLVGTHFHSEHILGESAFPPTARVIRARSQQQDIDEFGIQPNFASRSPAMAELMENARFRDADEFFDSERTVDLGGVRVRLLGSGRTHTNGDTLIFVEGDGVLFAGDVLMNERFLAFNTERSSVEAWLDSIETIDGLDPMLIVPSHGEMGDRSLIDTNRGYLEALRARVAEIKGEGRTLDETSDIVATEFRERYPEWRGSAAAAAAVAYREAP